MTGIGPRAAAQPAPEPGMDGEDLAAAASLAAQFYADGQTSVTAGGYPAGFGLGYDVGLGARNDAGRAFAAGVIEGHAAGLTERRRLFAGLAARQAPAMETEMEAG